ncbi:hypothetical protein RCL1_005490 [Eukaryota sp. TZLM3-RCL]
MSNNNDSLVNDLDLFLGVGNTSGDLGLSSDVAPPSAPSYMSSNPYKAEPTPPPKEIDMAKNLADVAMNLPPEVQAQAVSAAVSAFTGIPVDIPTPQNSQPSGPSASPSDSNAPFYKIQRYRFLFDVDTSDVSKRIGSAMLPLKAKSFVPSLEGKADVYGPFWLVTTLILLFGMSGNFSHLFSAIRNPEAAFSFNFQLLGSVASYCYMFFGLVPIVMWGLFAWLAPVCPKLLELYCIYGYSAAIFLISFVIDLLPRSFLLSMTSIAVGGAISGFFVLQALLGVVGTVESQTPGAVKNDSKSVLLSLISGGSMVGFIAGLQLVIFLYSSK